MQRSAVDGELRPVAERSALHDEPRVARLEEAADAVAVEKQRREERKSRSDIVLDRCDVVGDEVPALVERAVDLQRLGRHAAHKPRGDLRIGAGRCVAAAPPRHGLAGHRDGPGLHGSERSTQGGRVGRGILGSRPRELGRKAPLRDLERLIARHDVLLEARVDRVSQCPFGGGAGVVQLVGPLLAAPEPVELAGGVADRDLGEVARVGALVLGDALALAARLCRELADALPSIFIAFGIAYALGVLTGGMIFSSPSMIEAL
jgi:hypothetical protein